MDTTNTRHTGLVEGKKIFKVDGKRVYDTRWGSYDFGDGYFDGHVHIPNSSIIVLGVSFGEDDSFGSYGDYIYD